jgi:hypothetical protein
MKLKVFDMSPRIRFLTSLFVFTVVLRLLPYVLTSYDFKVDSTAIFYPWNFMPLMAACLYSGAYIGNRLRSFAAPLSALVASNLGIWAITGQFSWAFPSEGWAVYLCYAIAILMGRGLNRQAWPQRGVGALGRGIAAETVFFLLTNFAYFCVQTVHPHTLTGLAACYVEAIPFSTRSFVSTAFYSVLLFSPLAVRAASESANTEPVLRAELSR